MIQLVRLGPPSKVGSNARLAGVLEIFLDILAQVLAAGCVHQINESFNNITTTQRHNGASKAEQHKDKTETKTTSWLHNTY